VRPLERSLALALALTACSSETPGQTAAPADTGEATTTTGGIVLPTSGSPVDDGTSTGPGMKLDLPPEADLPGQTVGCAAVDVLFVIDNSKSMAQYQAALADAFPQFVDAMIANLPTGVDLHVGVTTTDFTCAMPGDPCCPDACPVGNTQCQIGSNPDEVELLMGFYVPPTDGDNGVNGAQGRLFEHDGMPYFALNTEDDPAPLKAWFTGAATAAGEQGSSLEMPVAAAGFAADPINDATNAGFLRGSDAILLIVFLTNDPDASLESVGTYRDMVLAAKGDCPECVLTAGLIEPCVPAEKQRLWQFMTAFGDEPIWGDIKAKGGYADVVGLSLAGVLGDACINIPVG
jgi:hypothetical protein